MFNLHDLYKLIKSSISLLTSGRIVKWAGLTKLIARAQGRNERPRVGT